MNRKRNKKKYIYLIIIFLFLCLFWYLLSNKTSLTYIEKVSKDIFYYFNDLNDNNTNVIDLSLSQEKDREIKELNSLLNIKNNMTNFNIIYSTVINKNVTNYLNLVTLDKGITSSITNDMAVINDNGLVGITTNTSYNYTNVKLLTNLSSEFQISVKINSNVPIFGILSDYLDNGDYVVSGIPLQDSINEGDVVVTSGLGSSYPEGIYIGEVKSIKKSNDGISNNAIISNKQNFNNIHYVAILERELS